MVIRTNFDSTEVYLHTAWSDEPDGTDMQTEEFDSIYIGTFSDSNSVEDLDNSKYSWSEIGADEEDEEEDTELSDSINDLTSSTTTLSASIDSAQKSTDTKVTNANELVGTNYGAAGWWRESAISTGVLTTGLSSEKATIYSDTDLAVNYLKDSFSAASASKYLCFSATNLCSKLDSSSDTYTLSFDVNMAVVADITDITVGAGLIDFEDCTSSVVDSDTQDTAGTWVHYKSTATATGTALGTATYLSMNLENLIAETGETLKIANLKIEAGANATAWTNDAGNISAKSLNIYGDLTADAVAGEQTLLLESWTNSKLDSSLWARNRIYTDANNASGSVGNLYLKTESYTTTYASGVDTIMHDDLTLYKDSESTISITPDGINMSGNTLTLDDMALEAYAGVSFEGSSGSVSGLIKGFYTENYTSSSATIAAGNHSTVSVSWSSALHPVAIWAITTTSPNAFVISGFDLNATGATATLRNVNSRSSASGTATFQIMFAY